jgi:adenosylcobinamide-phosphate synthase
MDAIYLISIPLIAGYVADLLFGDPERLPHPIIFFGNLIHRGEKLLNHGGYRFAKGMLLTVALIGSTYIFFSMAEYFLRQNDYVLMAFRAIFVWFGIANRTLIEEGKAVFRKLSAGLEEGRQQLSRIVGRETKNLNGQQIRTAVFETMSENLSDGVIAPLFYYAIGGIPGLMTYKMINTLDSMIAYRNERYEHFGKFAARLDDVANFIPARITVILMALVTLNTKAIVFAIRYGHHHKSPNSGYPEAALAGILNCQFGGPNYYHGVLVEKPYIGSNPRMLEDKEIKRVVYINHASTALAVALIIVCYILQ